MNSARMEFDEQNFDKLTVGFIGKYTEKRLEGKTLTNCWPFVKFVKVFLCQTFVLYSTHIKLQK